MFPVLTSKRSSLDFNCFCIDVPLSINFVLTCRDYVQVINLFLCVQTLFLNMIMKVVGWI